MDWRCCALVLGLLLVGSSGARADIYEWRDASGARNFTNSRDGVPAEFRDSARVLVADWNRSATPAAPAAAAPAAPAADGAEVVTDAAWHDGFAAGMRAAAELGGGGGGGGSGGSVQINGPLAIADVRAAETLGAGAFYPPWPWYYPFVTTSFDRGRSRHLTLRMLLQEQFQIDRDGPYAYERWDEPGLGPALAPFLPRGLPYGFSQYGRVISR